MKKNLYIKPQLKLLFVGSLSSIMANSVVTKVDNEEGEFMGNTSEYRTNLWDD